MKNVKYLISQISDLPFGEKLNYIQNIALFKEKLPKTVKKYIVSIYQKEKKIFIVVSHPAITTELKHKKQEIMLILKLLQDYENIFINVEDIVIFHTNKTQSLDATKDSSKIKKTFNEKSKATFINKLDDVTLYKKLENMRDIIVHNR